MAGGSAIVLPEGAAMAALARVTMARMEKRILNDVRKKTSVVKMQVRERLKLKRVWSGSVGPATNYTN
jgi:hypothetical protein